MGIVGSASHKLKKEGPISLAESVWRNSLRNTVAGSALRSLFDDVFVEKLVMAPRVGYWPQIREPRSFNEKIAHRKLCTDDPRFTKITDKVLVRDWVTEKFGDEILNEIYHVTDEPQTIPFESLPNSFVIKTGNKGVILVEDKEKEDLEQLLSECRSALESPYGVEKGEYWYGETDPKIICERRLYGKEYDIPIDYKFLCFHGRVEYIQANVDRFGNHTKSVYDRNWEYLDIEYNHPQGPPIEAPDSLDEMIDIAETLSDGFDFIRVDLYETRDEGVVFGELTPAPGGGAGRFRPKEVDFEWGEKW